MPPFSFRVNEHYAQLSELIPGLFICGVNGLTAANICAFRIQLIVNATREVPNLKCLGHVPRMKLWVEDTTDEDLFPHFDVVADQMHAVIRDGGAVLVHCVAGVSRSASICLAYLLKYHSRSLRAAFHLMCERRPLVRPNIGFWRQLIHYEQLIKGNVGSVRIVRDEAQPDKLLPDVYLRSVIPDKFSRPVSPNNEGGESASASTHLLKPMADEGYFQNNTNNNNNLGVPSVARHRRRSLSGGSDRVRFVPVLEPVSEIAEAAA